MMTYGRACGLLSPTMQFEWQCFCKYGLVNIIYGLLYPLVVNILSVLYPLVVNILSVTSWMSRILATPNYGLSLSANRRFMHSIQGELWRLYTANNLFVIYKIYSLFPSSFSGLKESIAATSACYNRQRLRTWVADTFTCITNCTEPLDCQIMLWHLLNWYIDIIWVPC